MCWRPWTHHDYIPFTQRFSFFPAFIQRVPGQKGRTILCISVDFLRSLIKPFKQMISWCNGLERCRQQQNNLSTAASAITKSLHPGKHFKYLPALVKQSGIILYCYKTGKRFSYFPYFRVLPSGWKHGGGSDWNLFVHKLPIDSLSSCRKEQLALRDKDLRHVKWLKINKCGYLPLDFRPCFN